MRHLKRNTEYNEYQNYYFKVNLFEKIQRDDQLKFKKFIR